MTKELASKVVEEGVLVNKPAWSWKKCFNCGHHELEHEERFMVGIVCTHINIEGVSCACTISESFQMKADRAKLP